jgi:DNA-binding MarR family transcriptional regulator
MEPETAQPTAARLRLAIGRLYRSFRHDGGDHDLTIEQLTLLATLGRNGPIRLGDLAIQEGIQPSTLTRSIGSLAARELVIPSVSAGDRRATTVVISETGRTMLDTAWEFRSSRLAARIAQLPAADRAALIDALPLLESLLDESDEPAR